MTINKKLSRMSDAYEIAETKIQRAIKEGNLWFHHRGIGHYRLSMATYSNISGEYAFSFWVSIESGEINEVVRVKEGELK
jgi:hypothetical protein